MKRQSILTGDEPFHSYVVIPDRLTFKMISVSWRWRNIFSLSEELKAQSKVYLRLRLNYKPGLRHTISLLYAPLTVLSDGSVGRDILYEGVTFPANSNIEASYKFNSYRLTYRYDIVQKPKLDFGLGFTAKIRDAKIDMTSGELYGEKINV